jgi:hypothetical protein
LRKVELECRNQFDAKYSFVELSKQGCEWTAKETTEERGPAETKGSQASSELGANGKLRGSRDDHVTVPTLDLDDSPRNRAQENTQESLWATQTNSNHAQNKVKPDLSLNQSSDT